ncbi:STY4851/ECs_5259 family protein [Mesorhizobium sp. ESP7-2]|uniref:STY4851/ECs_5259 family protein n=1 Tax=Mesorhizobium sp. ESP7-2 TaxID=2876622 RepID=UPI001CC98881|nr:STY4851/ECs_5259 family protein [Mesorhizobium sp. ESP7-2]MBZ9711168.1 STY4851/ECs_5259 family protein [Mesorhizobium sp. ESP7-2]
MDFERGPSSGGAGVRASPTNRFLNELLAQSGLEAPDGRPLYRYRMSDAQYSCGLDLVQRNSALLDQENHPLCAIFALVTSEWFRRQAETLWRRWHDVGVVPEGISVGDRNDIARAGLRWWGLEPIVTEGAHRTRNEYLMTLARNGGLPSTLLVGERANAVRAYFENAMADSLALPWPSAHADYLTIARRHAEDLPVSYQDGGILDLAAELIAGLIECRRALPKDQLNNNPAGWLDAQVKGWRERLPIYLPEDQASCSRLFNDLLTVEPKSRGGGIGLRRLLARDLEGGWREGFVVQADGPLQFDALRDQEEGRFRAYFAGSAARLTSREFALIYRSETDSKGRFEVMSQSLGHPGFVGPFAFSEMVTVALSREGRTLPTVCWPGGRGVASVCHVLQATGRDDRLELVGTGSVRSTAGVLFVWVSGHSMVLGHDGGGAERIWQSDRRALWRVEGMALVETEEGDRYRVQAGASSDDERRLDLETVFLPRVSLDDGSVQPVAAPLRPRTRGSDGDPRLRFLREGREVNARGAAEGLVTVQWLDDEGFLIDRARILALPQGFGIEGRIEAGGARVSWQGLQGWQVAAVDASGTQLEAERLDAGFVAPWQGQPTAQMRIRLIDPYGSAVTAMVDLAANETVLVDASGKIRKDAPELSPANLRGAVLLTDRPVTIDLDLRGAGSARALIARRVEGETPMVKFGALAESLLGLSAERGPGVVIRDDRSRPLCTIRRSQTLPFVNDGKVLFANLDADAFGMARPLLRPETELALVQDSSGLFHLPAEPDGPYLVYCRRGDAVVTRPCLIDAPVNAASSSNPTRLQASSLISNEEERRRAIQEELSSIGGRTASGAELSYLIRIVASLKGLSPRALDLMRELPSCPKLLCRLLLAASPERLEAILTLERDLPFLWMALPVDAWKEAAGAEWDRAVQELSTVFDPVQASKQATAQIQKRFETLAERTVWFAGVSRSIGIGRIPSQDLRAVAQDYLRLRHDQEDDLPRSLAEHAVRLGVPPGLQGFDYSHFPMLLVPLCLAGIACEKLKMTPDVAAGLRNALDFDSTYIATAYPHCLEFLSK